MVRLGSDIGGIDLNPGETITVGDQVYELTEDGELRGVDSLRVEKAAIDSNESIVRDTLDFATGQSVVGDDGTWYVSDGSDFYNGDSPFDLDTVGSLPESANTDNNCLHLTAGGSLLHSVNGEIIRSTNGGESWSTVQSLNESGNRIWTFTENGSGTIFASEYAQGVHLWKSTDDGETWSEHDTPDIADHIHKIRFHPADDDRVIMTQGDAEPVGYYRSDDEGESWDLFTPIGNEDMTGSGQMVGIGFDPNDPDIYYLGTDSAWFEGIIKIEDDGSGEPEVVHAQTGLTSSGPVATSGGVFTFRTVEMADRHFVTASTVDEGEEDMVWASTGPDAERWRAVSTADPGWRETTSSQGPGETVIDGNSVPYLISQDEVLWTPELMNPMYGMFANNYIPDGHPMFVPDGSSIRFENFRLRNDPGNQDRLQLQDDTDGSRVFDIRPDQFILRRELRIDDQINLQNNVVRQWHEGDNLDGGDLEWSELAFDRENQQLVYRTDGGDEIWRFDATNVE
jgi:hypothetical protein